MLKMIEAECDINMVFNRLLVPTNTRVIHVKFIVGQTIEENERNIILINLSDRPNSDYLLR